MTCSRPTSPRRPRHPSLDLPAYLAGYDRVIFVDAVADDAPPGTIRVYTRDEITSVPTGIRVSPHEPTINDALIVLDFAGTAPREVVAVVPETLEGGMALSPRVAGAVGRAGEVVRDELVRRTCNQVATQALYKSPDPDRYRP
jgi:hydrogenase maturation protease